MAQHGATKPEAMQPAPKVSVFILTCNHVAWIAQAIESALSQQAPFAYEIVVADDCSSDGTREIVREYEQSHPRLIRTVLPERNMGVRGIWPAAARSCRGEYVAVLEGDDYWTSPSKLARQAALLDARPTWTSCFHRATLFHDDGSAPPRPATPALERDAFELEDLLRACFIPFLTLMFRRRALNGVPEWVFTYAWFDWLFHIYCARQGSIGFLDEDMAAYRVHRGGNWSARDRSAQLEEDLRTYERLAQELPEHGPLIRRSVEQRHCQLAVEQGAVPSDTAIAVFDPVGDMPVYYNGRHAETFGAGSGAGPRKLTVAERIGAIVRAAAERPAPALHYGSRVAAESRWRDDSGSLPRAGRCLCVIPRSTEESVAREDELADLLAAAGEPAWSDEWCRIWEVEIDSPHGERGNGEGVTQAMGALVEIDEVNLLDPLPEQLRGGFLDQPRAGALLDAHAVDVLGWALGAQERATAAEFSIGGRPFWRAPLRVERPDLADAFSEVPEAAKAGFRTTLNMIGTPAEFELAVSVVLKSQRRVELATITGRHRWRRDRSPTYAELVSVVIPCYAQAHFLAEAIESVLAQTYPHLEIVVVDDESMDNASSIASRYPGVRCVRERNSGMAGARNVGIRATNGDFLVFLDADDRLLPEAIETGVRMLEEHPDCAAAIGAYRRTAHDGERLDTHSQPAVRSEQYSRLMRENWAGFPARAIYRRALFEHVHGFDAGVDAAADFAFNLAVAREFPIYSHEVLVAEHREHGHNISANAAKMLVETLRALGQQRGYARRDPELRRAYREGVRHWKRYWGGLLVDQARASWRERHLSDALRQILLLARLYPRGVPRLLRRGHSSSG